MKSCILRILILLITLNSLSGCSLLTKVQITRYIRYTVDRGDTISHLASRFNIDEQAIRDVNTFDEEDLLTPGQKIRIPYDGQKLSKEDEEVVRKFLVTRKRPVASKSAVAAVKASTAAKFIGQLKWPLETEGRVTSGFGRRWLSYHEGMDIFETEGIKVLAAINGKVVYSGSGLSGYGNLIVIKSDGLLTVYAHNRRNRVSVGDEVKTGEWIADVGATGKASGPHLHFETRIKEKDKNVAVDPMAFYP